MNYKIIVLIRDERGVSTGKVESVQVLTSDGSVIFNLETPLKFQYIDKNRFKVANAIFWYEQSDTFGGSWCFDEITLDEWYLLRLIWFLQRRKAVLEEAPSDFFDRWESNIVLGIDDLKLLRF